MIPVQYVKKLKLICFGLLHFDDDNHFKYLTKVYNTLLLCYLKFISETFNIHQHQSLLQHRLKNPYRKKQSENKAALFNNHAGLADDMADNR